jgi:hypothetical protein
VFAIGTTTVTYSAKDAATNTATCSFKVTVKDLTAPVFANCPANIAIAAGANCKAIVNWTPPTVSDNCSTVNVINSHNLGSEFNIGETEVIYTAKDEANNTSVCSFTVKVIDTAPPVFNNCPLVINLITEADCKGTASWTAPTASDNCGLLSITSTHNPGSEFSVGVTTVTYTATDIYGNTSTCHFDVMLSDNQMPVVSECPADIQAVTDGLRYCGN